MRLFLSLFFFSFSQASLADYFSYSKVDNWDLNLITSRIKVVQIVQRAAKNSSDLLYHQRQCQGRLIAIFVNPSSIKRTRVQESLKVQYQLSYNDNRCTHSLLVTCSLFLTTSKNGTHTTRHLCQNYPFIDFNSSNNDASPTSPTDNPDSRTENNSPNDGWSEPIRDHEDLHDGGI